MAQRHGQQALVFDFDSLRQRALWAEESSSAMDAHHMPPAAVTQRFSGLLRTADILTETILVPDAQLLDGALFMHHGPAAVRSLLARGNHERLGLVVVARHASLAECLRMMVLGRNSEASKLALFEFSSLAVFGLDPRSIAQAVNRRPSCRLRECHVQEVPRAEATAQDPSGLRVWDSAKFDMELAFARRPMPAELAHAEEQANETVAQAIAMLTQLRGRSSMLATLDSLKEVVPEQTLESIDTWWSSVYFDALARQHESSWLKLENSETEAVDMESSPASGSQSLQFEGRLIGVLSEMPASTFAMAKYAARIAISRWAVEPIPRHSDGLAFAIMKFVEPVDRQETMHNLWRQVSFTLIPGILGLAASYFFSTVAGIWAVVLGAVGVLLTTPVSELVELHSLRSKKMKAFINIPGGAHD